MIVELLDEADQHLGTDSRFNAITDDKIHATINTGTGEPNAEVDFGSDDQKAGTGLAGHNTVDITDMKKLDAPENNDGPTSGDTVAHETLEGTCFETLPVYEDAEDAGTQRNTVERSMSSPRSCLISI